MLEKRKKAPKMRVDLTEDDDHLIACMRPESQDVLRAKGSYLEICAQLNIKLGTLRSRLSRARMQLLLMRAHNTPPGSGIK